MAVPLTALGSKPTIHGLPRCACGCGRGADRGFPGDVYYATACVPPAMRFSWEAGYASPAEASSGPELASRAEAISDLFPGFAPA